MYLFFSDISTISYISILNFSGGWMFFGFFGIPFKNYLAECPPKQTYSEPCTASATGTSTWVSSDFSPPNEGLRSETTRSTPESAFSNWGYVKKFPGRYEGTPFPKLKTAGSPTNHHPWFRKEEWSSNQTSRELLCSILSFTGVPLSFTTFCRLWRQKLEQPHSLVALPKSRYKLLHVAVLHTLLLHNLRHLWRTKSISREWWFQKKQLSFVQKISLCNTHICLIYIYIFFFHSFLLLCIITLILLETFCCNPSKKNSWTITAPTAEGRGQLVPQSVQSAVARSQAPQLNG